MPAGWHDATTKVEASAGQRSQPEHTRGTRLFVAVIEWVGPSPFRKSSCRVSRRADDRIRNY
jgi:hypothetical protein